MKIDKGDAKDVGVWVAFIMFLFAVSYLAEGGQNLFVLLFAIAFGLLAVKGIFQTLSEFLEEYYTKKRDARKQ